MFRELGVPIYIADEEAKKLTNRSKVIRRKLVQLMGDRVYKNGELDRKFVADKIFNDPDLLNEVNGIIHPKVAAHFKRWIKKQSYPYCIKEAAVLFESGSYSDCDLTILVTAPKNQRVKRLLKRDNSTVAEIESRMANQWSDSKKIAMADVLIKNTDLQETEKQVKALHHKLLEA